MGTAIITLKINTESPDVDFEKIQEESLKLIAEFSDNGETKTEIEPIAFGLKALKITFVADESKGSSDSVESKIAGIKGVQSVECVDVRRALG